MVERCTRKMDSVSVHYGENVRLYLSREKTQTCGRRSRGGHKGDQRAGTLSSAMRKD